MFVTGVLTYIHDLLLIEHISSAGNQLYLISNADADTP